MIQLNFSAVGAAQALKQQPTEIGYSQHEGAERAAWDDEKLELVDARIRSSTSRTARTRTSSTPHCSSGGRRRKVSAATTPAALT